MTPTTQAVEQLREKIKHVLQDAMFSHDDAHKKGIDAILSALADTLKIVGGEIIGQKKSINRVNAHIDIEHEGANRLIDEQRQRLELVVGEMKNASS